MRPAGRVLAASMMLVGAANVMATEGAAQTRRDYVSIVSTPDLTRYSETLLSDFGSATRFKFPELRITNLSAAVRLFCAGSGIEYPDIAFLWQPMSDAQREACIGTVGPGIAEVLIGFEALAAVRLRPAAPDAETETEPMNLSSLQLFSAMAEFVPVPANHPDFKDGASRTLVPNQSKSWQEIDTGLADREIHVVAPPRGHSDADILYATVLGAGCRQVEGVLVFEESDPGYFQQLCENFRVDGRLESFNASRGDLARRLEVVEAGYAGIEALGDPMLYQASPAAEEPLAIGFIRLHELAKSDALEALAMDGALPELTLVRNGLYPAARPVYLLIKVQNFALVPGFRDFVRELSSSRVIGEGGMLTEIGLVPLSKEAIGSAVDTIFDAIRDAASGPAEPGSAAEAEAAAAGTADALADETSDPTNEPDPPEAAPAGSPN